MRPVFVSKTVNQGKQSHSVKPLRTITLTIVLHLPGKRKKEEKKKKKYNNQILTCKVQPDLIIKKI